MAVTFRNTDRQVDRWVRDRLTVGCGPAVKLLAGGLAACRRGQLPTAEMGPTDLRKAPARAAADSWAVLPDSITVNAMSPR